MASKFDLKIVFSTLLGIGAFDAAAANITLNCTNSGSEVTFADIADLDGNNNRYGCRIDGQTMRIQLHKLGICTAEPTPADFGDNLTSKCAMLYSSDTGQTATISRGGSSDLADIDVSNLVEGDYSHAIIVIGDSLESKYSVNFPAGTTILGHSGSGNHCWTRDTSAYAKNPTSRNQLSAECGSAAAAPGFAKKAFGYFGGSNTKLHTNGNKTYLLKSMSEQAVASDGDSIAFTAGVVVFSSPKKLSAKTQTIDLGFELTNLGRAEFITNTAASCDTNSQPCLNSLRPWDFDFCVEFDAKCQ